MARASEIRTQTKSIHDAFDSNSHAAQLALKPNGGANALSSDLRQHLQNLEVDGYTIIRDALSSEQVEEVRAAVNMLLGPVGRNNFEGTKTQRVYSLSSKARTLSADGKTSTSPLDVVAMNPKVLAILDQVLLPNYLLTAYQAIKILPGESRQPYHHDDQFTNVPRPRQPLSYGVVFAIDEFDDENGGTIVFPGSHRWGSELPPEDAVDGATRGLPTTMPSGSCVLFCGTLWHAGGPNRSTDRARLAVTTQYCEPWMRPQENLLASMPPEHGCVCPARLQSLLGFSVHPPFIGHVDGEHPLKWLEKRARGRVEAKL